LIVFIARLAYGVRENFRTFIAVGLMSGFSRVV
jgi:hypothetical protein